MSHIDYKNYLPTHFHSSVHDDVHYSVDHTGYSPLYTPAMLQQKISYIDTRRLRTINEHLAVRRDNVRQGGVDTANTYRDSLGLDQLTSLGKSKQVPIVPVSSANASSNYNPFAAIACGRSVSQTVNSEDSFQRARWERQAEKSNILDNFCQSMKTYGVIPKPC